MNDRRKNFIGKIFFDGSAAKTWLILFLSLFFHLPANAGLSLESVYPTLGRAGEALPVTIKGSGFDEQTKIAMYLDASNAKTFIDRVPLPGSSTRLVSKADLIYVACGRGGIGVIDIGSRSGPSIVAIIDTPGEALDLCLNGDYLFVADGTAGLVIFDLSDPRHPNRIGGIDTPGNATGVETAGSIAYVSDGNGGLQVIDAGDPSRPVIIGAVEMNAAYSLALRGDYAFVGGSPLLFLDISTPSAPIVVKRFDISAFQTTVIDDLLFVSTKEDLIVMDVSAASRPVELSRSGILHNGYYTRVARGERGICYVTDGDKGLQALDMTDMEKPRFLAFVDTDGYASDIGISGDTAYLADGDKGLKIIDIRPSSLYTNITIIDTDGDAQDIALDHRNHLYLADGTNGLRIYEISDSFNPVPVGSLNLRDSLAIGVLVRNDLVYLTRLLDGLQIIDVADPAAPFERSFVSLPGCTRGSALAGNTIYTTDLREGFHIIDGSDPGNPAIIGRWEGGGTGVTVMTGGDYAYVTGDLGASIAQGFHIFDIQNPTAPEFIGGYGIDAYDGFARLSSGFSVADNRAYLLHEFGSPITAGALKILDISDPGSIVETGAVDLPGKPLQVIVKDGAAYIANYRDGVTAVDVSDPYLPQEMGTMHLPGYANAVAYRGNIGYAACGKAGLVVFPLPVRIDAVVEDSTTLSATIPASVVSGHYTLRVYNRADHDELPGAFTFVPPSEAYLLETKAIIAAGTDADNKILQETNRAADYAYQSLLYQGYTDESICYLNPDPTLENADRRTTLANLEYCVKEWARQLPQATELLIYFVDHGTDGRFMLNADEDFSGDTLGLWLDELQGELDIPVLFIYDACRSGSFIPMLSPSPGERTLMASSQSFEEAFFLNQGTVSFSYQFWDAILGGNSLDKAFHRGRNQIEEYQTPVLEADNNGSGNETADNAAIEGKKIGRGYRPRTDIPYIYEITAPKILVSDTAAALSLKVNHALEMSEIERVWGIVEPPDFDPVSPDIPVTALPEFDLLWDAEADGYRGAYDGFTENGTYKITLCAINDRGAYALFREAVIEKHPDYIREVSAHQVLYGDEKAKLWAAIDPGGEKIAEVWAEIIPPCDGVEPLIRYLSDEDDDGIFEALYGDYSGSGVYEAIIYAADASGHTTTGSSMFFTRHEDDPALGKDEFEDDDTRTELKWVFDINSGLPEKHNFHAGDDVDWLKFLAVQGFHYIVKVDQNDAVGELSVHVFDAADNEIVPLFKGRDLAAGAESVEFIPSETGPCFVKISNGSPERFGPNVSYDIRIYRPVASSISGYIEGTVVDIYGEPIPDARIWTSSGGSDISREDGGFRIIDLSGEAVLYCRAEGYRAMEMPITVPKNERLFQMIRMLHREAGDANGDGHVDLGDLMMILRFLAGHEEPSAIEIDADVNGDRRIGLTEAVWILKDVAGGSIQSF